MKSDTKKHWETVYETKQPNEVSWTQENPKISLDFIRETQLDKTAKIIDIGGGDSKLVDYLLEEGYENISVLDISAKALERAKNRLGPKADKVTWIVSDVTEFRPETSYALWHDRAAFHFLTSPEQVKTYINTVRHAVSGYLILGTFSEKGPSKCSGLDIKQYSETRLEGLFSGDFKKQQCLIADHKTPFDTLQNFLFCSFKRNDLK